VGETQKEKKNHKSRTNFLKRSKSEEEKGNNAFGLDFAEVKNKR